MCYCVYFTNERTKPGEVKEQAQVCQGVAGFQPGSSWHLRLRSQLQLFCTAFYVTSPLEQTSEGSELAVCPWVGLSIKTSPFKESLYNVM